MKRKTTPFVSAIVLAAAAVTWQLPTARGSGTDAELMGVMMLAGLTLAAELLAFLLPKGAMASISSMPVLAAVLISPSWHAVVATALVKAISELVRRAELEKAVFNVAQYALTVGVAAFAYLYLGGESLLSNRFDDISSATMINGMPAFLAFVVAGAVNTLSVSAVIALSTGSSLSAVWHAHNIAKIGIDIVASPLIFLFAWAYVRFGAIAAASMWVPLIGLRQVYKTNLQLEQTNVELLDLMVKSIEARDTYTSGHSRRVRDYSLVIGRALGLSEKQLQAVGRAALLHDVGKIHEKYGPLLRKGDRLSPDEWNTMKEHPADGANLIATMSPFRDLVGPVRHHHENWDGTGYPDGLAGEMIPLAARIIRFADTIDAMTTARPYRPGLTSAQVRSEIIRHRGTQFDPQIVDRLLSSPAWKTMLGPEEASSSRFRSIAILPKGDPAASRTVGA
jgi:HD-GYP domain-containing protein (c-di-GMP phosphodiesterase class II)